MEEHAGANGVKVTVLDVKTIGKDVRVRGFKVPDVPSKNGRMSGTGSVLGGGGGTGSGGETTSVAEAIMNELEKANRTVRILCVLSESHCSQIHTIDHKEVCRACADDI